MQENLHTQDPQPSTTMRARRRAPGPRYLTPFGMLADFRRGPLKFYLDAAKFGDVVRFQTGPLCSHFLPHPEHIKYVLQDHNQNYGRSSFMDTLIAVFT